MVYSILSLTLYNFFRIFGYFGNILDNIIHLQILMVMKKLIRYFERKFRKSDEKSLLKLTEAIFLIMKRNNMIKQTEGQVLTPVTLYHWKDGYQDNPAKIEIQWNCSDDKLSCKSKIKNFES